MFIFFLNPILHRYIYLTKIIGQNSGDKYFFLPFKWKSLFAISFINKIAGQKKAKVENRPGVTLAKQWVPTSIGIDLMDMPGVLWPKFEDKKVGENLAITGAIRDKVLNLDEISLFLLERLARLYPELISKRYNIKDLELIKTSEPYELFELIGKKRGMLISGGDIDTDRVAIMLMDEFRSARIGRITLEFPDEISD